MTQVKVRNISGKDLVVPTPRGELHEALAGHQIEVDADLAKGLLEQRDVWERVKDAPAKKDEG